MKKQSSNNKYVSFFFTMVVLSASLGSVTASAQEVSANASTQYVQLGRDAVSAALAPSASGQDIKRAEEILLGVGWMALYDTVKVQVFRQSWYLAMPAGGLDITRINSLREVAGFEIDTTVSIAPTYKSLVEKRLGIAKEATATADDFRTAEASIMALGWMILYGNGAESASMARQLSDAAARFDVDYTTHTHTAYFEMLNLARFEMPSRSAPLTGGASYLQAAEPSPLTNDLGWIIFTNQAINCPPTGCIASGPGCDTQAVRGQCSFPRNNAIGLCMGHPECRAVTCNAARNDCQARSVTDLDIWRGFTSYVPPPSANSGTTQSVAAPVIQSGNTIEFLANGAGEVVGLEGTFRTDFELWGNPDGFDVEAIRFDVNDMPFEIIVAEGDRVQGSGHLTPCADGICSCSLKADEEAGYVEGSCSNSAHPEHGEMKFNFQLVDGTSAVQQFELMTTAAGEVVSPDVGRLDAQFDVLGDGEQVRLFKVNAGGKSFEIAVDVNNDGGNDGTGQLSPCEDGVCRCEMSEVDYGVRGSCTNSAYPEHGAMQFSIWVNGRPAAQQFELMASAAGEVVSPDVGRLDAEFDVLGDGEQVRLIKMNAGGNSFEIAVDINNDGGNDGTGQLSPCEDGVCRCNMSEVDYGIQGSCTNTAYPEHGAMRFSVFLNGRPPAPENALSVPPGRPVLMPPVQKKQSGEAVPVSVRIYSNNNVLSQHPNIGKVYNAPIWLDVTMSDGTVYKRIDYEKKFPNNIVYDDISGDPNDLIQVFRNNRYNNRRWMRPTGSGVAGNAALRVSFRNAPGVTAALQLTVDDRLAASVNPPVTQSAPSQPSRAQPIVPVALRVWLRTNTVINSPSYHQKTYTGPGEGSPPIYVTVTFSDGSTMGPNEYQKKFNQNLIFDDTSGDPNDLIAVSYWDIDGKGLYSNTPGPRMYAAQLNAPSNRTGRATLKVSLRNTPGINVSIPITVVGAPVRKAAPPPVTRPPAEPQPTLLGTGNGEFNDTEAGFSVYGLDGKATQIRISNRGRNYVFHIDTNSYDQDELKGRLTPCGGGACSCTMFEEGEGFYMGSCSASNPNNEVYFSFRVQ